MYHGMYEHRDEWGKVYHTSARIGGFKTEEAAIKAVVKRGGIGYVSDARNVVLCVVRNGRIVK
jgi:hypothetical protein